MPLERPRSIGTDTRPATFPVHSWKRAILPVLWRNPSLEVGDTASSIARRSSMRRAGLVMPLLWLWAGPRRKHPASSQLWWRTLEVVCRRAHT